MQRKQGAMMHNPEMDLRNKRTVLRRHFTFGVSTIKYFSPVELVRAKTYIVHVRDVIRTIK